VLLWRCLFSVLLDFCASDFLFLFVYCWRFKILFSVLWLCVFVFLFCFMSSLFFVLFCLSVPFLVDCRMPECFFVFFIGDG